MEKSVLVGFGSYMGCTVSTLKADLLGDYKNDSVLLTNDLCARYCFEKKFDFTQTNTKFKKSRR